MSDAVLFHGGPVAAPTLSTSEGWVLTQEGRIVELGSGQPPQRATWGAEAIDLAGQMLAPGLIDLHTHGALGCDTMDADPAALRTMAAFYARHGVTGFLATTMTASLPEILAALHAVGEVMASGTGGATLLGAHLEGPFLDPGHAGAQAAAHVTRASAVAGEELLGTGVIRLLTIAPEFPENRELILAAIARGVVVSMGHTGADYEAACEAVRLGVTHVTHLYNAMAPLHHREPGVVGAALTHDVLTCELIVDGVHVHPAVVALTYRVKGPDHIALITDAMSGTGMPNGSYVLGGQVVAVQEGVARGPGGVLAGSTLTMERALANMARATGERLEAVLPMGSRVPARVLGLTKGDIAPGRDADLIVLDSAGEVSLTMVQGQIVWRR